MKLCVMRVYRDDSDFIPYSVALYMRYRKVIKQSLFNCLINTLKFIVISGVD